MADLMDLPEPDAAEGAPHPRHAAQLFGHRAAQDEFLAAFRSGRLHHAWLLTGPPGIGKATLAWKLAAFLRAQPLEAPVGLFGEPDLPETLDLPPDHPVRRRMVALSEPGLLLVRRGPNEKGDRLETQITVGPVRRLKNFFHLSVADGGRRVVIIDPADEMNPNAANALLKELEEPPRNTTFLIICHQPHRLLPTIRSRCRVLRLAPLPPQDLAAALEQAGIDPGEDAAALADLANGSAGDAVRLLTLEGLGLWRNLTGLMAGAPGLDRQKAVTLSEGFAGQANAQRLDLLLGLLDLLLSRLARAGVGVGASGAGMSSPEGTREAALLARLSPGHGAAMGWATAQQELMARVRHGRAVNLDPGSLILDTLLRIDETASRLALR